MPLETTPRLFRLARCCIDDFQHVREAREDYKIPSHPIRFRYIDFEQILGHLDSMKQVCLGTKAGGALAQLDQTERFRWLTAKRSTLIQCSSVHPGLCVDAKETHQELFKKLVL